MLSDTWNVFIKEEEFIKRMSFGKFNWDITNKFNAEQDFTKIVEGLKPETNKRIIFI